MWISESENETSSSANGDCATHLTAYCSVLMANKPLWLIQNQVQHYITWRKWIISELEFRKRWNSLMKAHQHYSTKLQVHVTSSSLPACKTIQGLAPLYQSSVSLYITSIQVPQSPDTFKCVVPQKTTLLLLGDRSFDVSRPQIWSKLQTGTVTDIMHFVANYQYAHFRPRMVNGYRITVVKNEQLVIKNFQTTQYT